MTFSIGDKAVFPAHGVGVIREIEPHDLNMGVTDCYVMHIIDSGTIITVPVKDAEGAGMRPVVEKSYVSEVYAVLSDRDTPPDSQTWNRRYREYNAKIKTGDLVEIAKVLRDLALIKKNKALSFGERKMYEQAHGLLVQEISISMEKEESVILEEIEALFA